MHEEAISTLTANDVSLKLNNQMTHTLEKDMELRKGRIDDLVKQGRLEVILHSGLIKVCKDKEYEYVLWREEEHYKIISKYKYKEK